MFFFATGFFPILLTVVLEACCRGTRISHHLFFVLKNKSFGPKASKLGGATENPPMLRLGVYVHPRKTNMEPENESLEEEIPTNNHHFPVPC